MQFDARGSRPGSADDAITEYRWDFGDGSPVVRGADATQPEHVYERNGAYVATLTVCDEDNCAEVEVRVEVRDVDPTVGEVQQPDEVYEIRPMRFSVDAEPGSPADPTTSPFSVLSPDGGLVAVRVHVPYQAAALASYHTAPGGPFEPNLQLPNLADDGAVAVAVGSPAPPGDLLGGFEPDGAYGGPYGLGRLFTLGNEVRPFRRLFAAQSIQRRELPLGD